MNKTEINYITPILTRTFYLFFIYKMVLDLTYSFIISPIYNYSYLIVNFNILKYIFSWIILFIIAYITPKDKLKVSSLVLELHSVITIIPMLTMYAFTNQSTSFLLMVIICFTIEIVFIKNIKKFIKIPKITNSTFVLYTLIYLCTVITYVSLIKANGFHFEVINFSNVYAVRENIVLPYHFMGYLVTWQMRVINPYMIVSSFFKNKKVSFALFISLQVILYFVMANKEIILSIILILGVIIVVKNYSFIKCAFVALFLAIIGSVSLVSLTIMPIAIITRFLIEPAIIKFQHFEVFSKYENKLFFSEGLIGKVLRIKYPYEIPSGVLVHGYFDKGVSNSNTGYLASAYDNMGFLGMIIMSFVFILILYIFDSLSSRLNKNYVFALIIYQMITLNDGDLLTILLSGGLFLCIIILFLDQESFVYKPQLCKSKCYNIHILQRLKKLMDKNLV